MIKRGQTKLTKPHGLVPSAAGKLTLSFVPSKNYALVNAIEVNDESE